MKNAFGSIDFAVISSIVSYLVEEKDVMLFEQRFRNASTVVPTISGAGVTAANFDTVLADFGVTAAKVVAATDETASSNFLWTSGRPTEPATTGRLAPGCAAARDIVATSTQQPTAEVWGDILRSNVYSAVCS